jgi:hypothetical protein
MINKTKTFAIAILVAGATVTATRAPAAKTADTNTFTNVIQELTINLTVYSNAPTKSLTSLSGGKAVALTTKSIIAALSNDSANIPSLVGFDWGKSPQLVIDTILTNSASVSNTLTVVTSNTVLLSSSNNVISFEPTNAFPGTTNVAIVGIGTNGSAIITNNAVGTNAGTNLLTTTGTWTQTGTSVSTTNFSYLGTNTLTNLSAGFPTNVGVWTVITASTNASGTNVTAITYTNVAHLTIALVTNGGYAIEVEGGTAKDPTFADVSEYVSANTDYTVTNTAVGTGFGTTNAIPTSGAVYETKRFSFDVFGTSGTAVGNNLSLGVYGFAKGTFADDVLSKSKTAGTNEVPDGTYTASVSGHGYIGGTYVTNSAAGNAISLPANEYHGTNTAFTNEISGSLTNPIPVVVEGTISLGAPKTVAQ